MAAPTPVPAVVHTQSSRATCSRIAHDLMVDLWLAVEL
jgi:hypothetical protein